MRGKDYAGNVLYQFQEGEEYYGRTLDGNIDPSVWFRCVGTNSKGEPIFSAYDLYGNQMRIGKFHHRYRAIDLWQPFHREIVEYDAVSSQTYCIHGRKDKFGMPSNVFHANSELIVNEEVHTIYADDVVGKNTYSDGFDVYYNDDAGQTRSAGWYISQTVAVDIADRHARYHGTMAWVTIHGNEDGVVYTAYADE